MINYPTIIMPITEKMGTKERHNGLVTKKPEKWKVFERLVVFLA